MEEFYLEYYLEGRHSKLAEVVTLDRLDELVAQAEQIYNRITGKVFLEPGQEVREAIIAVANSYKEAHSGTGISVQRQVLGNIDDGKSFSGVLFSRNPYDSLYNDGTHLSRVEEMSYSDLTEGHI